MRCPGRYWVPHSLSPPPWTRASEAATREVSLSVMRDRLTLATALAVTTALVLLSAMVRIPPVSMGLFPLAVGASEMSPFLVLLDLVWCLAVNRMLRGRGMLRGLALAALVGGAFVAVLPLTQFTRVAEAASAQLGTEASAPRFSLVTAVRGLPASGDVRERIVNYAAADGSPLTLRVFSLAERRARPTVVVIYGGAWRGGDATQCENVSRALASRGFTVAAIDYRHAPTFRSPAQLLDVRRSIALLVDSAAVFGIDPERMGVLGRSSGGHLAELAAFSPGGSPLRAVVSIYAPYDLVEGYRDLPSPDPIDVQMVLRDFIGGTPTDSLAGFRRASPASYIRPGLPPTLLIFGGRDHVVKPAFNRRAASELRAARVPVVAVEIPWAEHGFDMAPAGLGAQLAFNVIVAFLERELMQ